MKKILCLLLIMVFAIGLVGCDNAPQNTIANKEKSYTEKVKKQSLASIGLPNIKNFFEMGQLKTIYELRDDPKTICYWYVRNQYTGKWVYCGRCVGYGIPYSTQITNPNQVVTKNEHQTISMATVDQAEPNGMYSTGSNSATWVLCLDNKGKIHPAYIEEEVNVFPFKLTENVQ